MRRLLRMVSYIILLVGCLVGCNSIATVDARVELGAAEEWSVEVLISFFKEDADLNQDSIAQTLDQTRDGLISQGVGASWKRDDQRGAEGSAVYVLDLSGNGVEKLSRTVFQQPGAFLLTKNGALHQIDVSFVPLLSLAQVQTVRYTIQGGEIVSTNGNVFDRNTVFWLNPNGKMVLTMKEPTRTNWLAYGLLAGGAILLGISIFGLTNLPMRKTKKADTTQPIPVHPPEPGLVICEHCLAEIPVEAVFCPNCGKHC